jgi:hypothetical protein
MYTVINTHDCVENFMSDSPFEVSKALHGFNLSLYFLEMCVKLGSTRIKMITFLVYIQCAHVLKKSRYIDSCGFLFFFDAMENSRFKVCIAGTDMSILKTEYLII